MNPYLPLNQGDVDSETQSIISTSPIIAPKVNELMLAI